MLKFFQGQPMSDWRSTFLPAKSRCNIFHRFYNSLHIINVFGWLTSSSTLAFMMKPSVPTHCTTSLKNPKISGHWASSYPRELAAVKLDIILAVSWLGFICLIPNGDKVKRGKTRHLYAFPLWPFPCSSVTGRYRDSLWPPIGIFHV
ncbi:uncharacterized protein B0T23DRAFT_70663 [Neurospora hispaniola]|uniref:Uncharacterized protein n=1 Tax=Neurospora hispaniola TaxID=588809 RepID=A0AAJ0MTH1_9PEZI|nr:hypothetical protein B0T23DRAFT_70663 [Neurospora hispaniola]